MSYSRRRNSFGLFLSVVVLALPACGGDKAVAPTVTCQSAIAVSVETGTSPRFNWTPACGVHEIAVVAPPGNGSVQVMWAIASDTRLIGPGIRYGDTPSGTQTVSPAVPVTHGTSYVVTFTGEPGQA